MDVEEDYYGVIRDERIQAHRVQIGTRWFEHDYKNPPSMSDIMPGDVFLIHSQLSSFGVESTKPLVFLGGYAKSLKVLGHILPTFKYKFLGNSSMMVGIMAFKMIYVEVWP